MVPLEVSPRSVFFFKDSALESVQRLKVLTSSPCQPQKLTTLLEPSSPPSVLVHGGDSMKDRVFLCLGRSFVSCEDF